MNNLAKPLEVLIEEETKEFYDVINKYALSSGITVLIVKDVLHNCLIAESRIVQPYRIAESIPALPVEGVTEEPIVPLEEAVNQY